MASLEDHLLYIQALVREFRPDRIAIDSLSALSRTSTDKAFREFVIALTSFLKHQDITSMFTVTTTLLSGGTSDTEGNISPLTDTIILLRYVEISGEMHRGLSVLKMRGSRHDSAVRGFTIDDKGINIGEPFMGERYSHGAAQPPLTRLSRPAAQAAKKAFLRAAACDILMKKLSLQLFINGENHVSAAAVLVLQAIGDAHVVGEFGLEIVDIQLAPDRAEATGIIAIPTLIRSWPLPVTRLIGALSVRSRVLAGLGLPTANVA